MDGWLRVWSAEGGGRRRRPCAPTTYLAARVDRAAVALLDAVTIDRVQLAAARMLGRLLLIVVEARAPWRGSVVVEVAGRHVVRVAVVLRRALPTGVGLVPKALEFDKPTGVPAPVNIFKLD